MQRQRIAWDVLTDHAFQDHICNAKAVSWRRGANNLWFSQYIILLSLNWACTDHGVQDNHVISQWSGREALTNRGFQAHSSNTTTVSCGGEVNNSCFLGPYLQYKVSCRYGGQYSLQKLLRSLQDRLFSQKRTQSRLQSADQHMPEDEVLFEASATPKHYRTTFGLL